MGFQFVDDESGGHMVWVDDPDDANDTAPTYTKTDGTTTTDINDPDIDWAGNTAVRAPMVDSSGNTIEGGWVTKLADGSTKYEDPDGSVYYKNANNTYTTNFGGETMTYDPAKGGFVDASGKLLKSTAADTLSSVLDKFKGAFTKNGSTDWGKLMTLGAGLYGASKSGTNTVPAGYQGKVPQLTAERQMLTAPIQGRRPGSGGIDYGGNVNYRDSSGKIVPGLGGGVRSLLDLQTAAAANPYNKLSAQSKADMYNNLVNQGYSDADIRASTDKTTRQTTPDWTYLQRLANGATPEEAKNAFMASKGGFELPENWSKLNAQQKIDWYNANNIGADKLTKAGVSQGDIDWMSRHQYTGKSPQTMASSIGLTLPQDWAAKNATQKIDYLNQNNVSPESLATAGVSQSDIDWMKNNQYTGVSPQNMAAAGGFSLPSDWNSLGATGKMDYLNKNNVTADMLGKAGVAQGDIDWIQNNRYAGGQGLARGGLASNGFVVPADVVSHLGNGSTNAGLRLLADKFGAEPIHGKGDGMSDSIKTHIDGKQEARVADGEAFIRPETVAKLGGGDTEKGAKKLYAMLDKVRQARTGNSDQGKEINPDKFMPGGSVNSYVGGGTTVPAGATGMESSLSNWVGDYTTNMLGQGAALANAPYQAYTGPLTAGASDLQTKVFTGLQDTNFPGNLGQSFTNTTAPTIGADGTPSGGGGIASTYMNPYLKNVLQPQLDELRRTAQINNLSGLGALTKSGAFGGGRQAIMESEAARNLLNAQNTAIGTGYANAYDKAMQQFNTEQGQGATLAGLMASQGATQRGIESEGIAADKAQFEEARLNPYKMVQFQQSLLSGLPLQSQTYNLPATDNLTQFANSATTLNKALAALGIK